MPSIKCFKDRYEQGNIPWNLDKPDSNLIEVVKQKNIKECKVLDIGCGTGDNSIWLARNGFSVTGIDVAALAIDMAKEKASKAGVRCSFAVADFLRDKIKEAPFGFVFDRGCFHCFDLARERKKYAENVAAYLKKNGLWLSLIGNADENRPGEGPPQYAAIDVVKAVEPHFEILLLKSGHFTSNSPDPPRAWVCLMQKR